MSELEQFLVKLVVEWDDITMATSKNYVRSHIQELIELVKKDYEKQWIKELEIKYPDLASYRSGFNDALTSVEQYVKNVKSIGRYIKMKQ